MELISDLLRGDLTTPARIWTSLWPCLLVTTYFLGGLVVYSIRSFFRGTFHDEEFESRGESVFLSMWFRLYFIWLVQPWWNLIRRTGIPANAITTLSLLIAIAAGFAVAAGRFALGGWLYVAAGILDVMDGRLARATNQAGPRGDALDSILDRYADGAILMGLSWYYRDTWVLAPALLALVGSEIVPYVRARGAALGVTVKNGVMQRAERIAYLGALTALSPVWEAIVRPDDPRPIHTLAVVGIVLLAISTHVTALQRLVFLLNALSEKPTRDTRESSALLGKNVVAAVSATATDFAVFTGLVSLFMLSPVPATAVGCLVGAMVNFTMNRQWTFRSNGPRTQQISRYGFVSLTSALLNMGGVAVLLLLPSVDYKICWLVVRAAVFVTWNFPLHRDYVFRSSTPTTQPG